MNDDSYQLTLARRIAHREHDGQFDKAGEPYIRHPEAVAARLAGHPRRQAMALLHDVPEDTPATIDMLRAEGVAEDILTVVEALTHRGNEPREDYNRRVLAAGDNAVAVKVADILENDDPVRLARLDGDTRRRLGAKYAKARRFFGIPERKDAS